MAKGDYILGISSHFHDSAAALVQDGRILAAAQEERFSRVKGDWAFPEQAIKDCLSHCPDPDRLKLAFYEHPRLKLERVMQTAARTAPRGAALWPHSLRLMRDYGHDLPARLLQVCDDPDRILCVPHHRSHAASAFYASPYASAAVLVVDGVGEWSTTSLWKGEGKTLTPLGEIRFPNSLGLFYSAFTQYCGFKVNSGEYKLMGLAPFGKPRFNDLIRHHMFFLKPDGSFELNMDCFRFDTDVTTISPFFENLLGRPRRLPDTALDPHYMDVAASAQQVLHDTMGLLAHTALQMSGESTLCMAGGVALNCVANRHLLETVPGLDQIWVQPASGDAGGALGAALDVGMHDPDTQRVPKDIMAGAYLGPGFTDDAIGEELDRVGLIWDKPDDIASETAKALADGLIVGHFDGRMEFGPRSLGNRSILADPRPDDMLDRLNLKIKFREGWRPFAPMVLKDVASQLFDGPTDSPYMLLVADLKEEHRHATTLAGARADGLYDPLELMRAVSSDFSAVTHVDFSARLQTVDPEESHTRAAAILKAFHDLTGCPMLVNTSFNVRGEPIVCTPRDAMDCFLNTHMDVLVIGPYLVRRAAQPDKINLHIGHRIYDAD
ncbi:MAG: carbamoyltransferase N-terminal domain-containing protein [Pseudomonadota bacterium]